MNQTVFNQQLPMAIGSDHAGYLFKEIVKKHLVDAGWAVVDKGAISVDSVDYPDVAHPVAELVASGAAAAGILLCGSGNGVSMTANKHQGIRAALCWNEESATLARQHNNANILCLPARFIHLSDAIKMVDIFLATSFEGGRHERRVEKI